MYEDDWYGRNQALEIQRMDDDERDIRAYYRSLRARYEAAQDSREARRHAQSRIRTFEWNGTRYPITTDETIILRTVGLAESVIESPTARELFDLALVANNFRRCYDTSKGYLESRLVVLYHKLTTDELTTYRNALSHMIAGLHPGWQAHFLGYDNREDEDAYMKGWTRDIIVEDAAHIAANVFKHPLPPHPYTAYLIQNIRENKQISFTQFLINRPNRL